VLIATPDNGLNDAGVDGGNQIDGGIEVFA
jgi:hypothetical protein